MLLKHSVTGRGYAVEWTLGPVITLALMAAAIQF